MHAATGCCRRLQGAQQALAQILHPAEPADKPQQALPSPRALAATAQLAAAASIALSHSS
jgi:hypothetical protein